MERFQIFDASPPAGLYRAVHDLWGILQRAGPQPTRAFWVSILFTGLASVGDIASIWLLGSGISKLLQADGVNDATTGVIAFLIAAVVATSLRLMAQRQTVAAQYAITRALSTKAFNILQLQGYDEYLCEGASAGFSAFERLNMICNQALIPFITAISSLLGSLGLLVAIGLLYPIAALPVAIIVALLFAEVILSNLRSRPNQLSALAQTRNVLLYEARSAFREIFLTNGQQRMYIDFTENETALRSEQASSVMSAQSSRFSLELAGLVTALLLILIWDRVGTNSLAVASAVAVLALAALRLLPQLAALRSSLRMVSLYGHVAGDVRALLDRPERVAMHSSDGPIVMADNIVIENICLRRTDRPSTLRGLSLTICRGSKIGISGASGSGKSSLLDIICGALAPDEGRVLIDGVPLALANSVKWRERIGVVSQNPILLGRTLREAVVFPERADMVDEARLAQVIATAGIPDMLPGFEKGLDTPIGEAVTFLSGGQRQRLALAHALYRARDLLILDEATGQLDLDSEAAIVASLQNLPADITLIVVSHRDALFACCDQVYGLEDGKLSLIA